MKEENRIGEIKNIIIEMEKVNRGLWYKEIENRIGKLGKVNDKFRMFNM